MYFYSHRPLETTLTSCRSKLYEAFAAGKPLITRRGVGEIGEILEEYPAEILLDEVTARTIGNAIAELKKPEIYQEKHAAANAARMNYNWAKAEEFLQDIYIQLTEST